MGSLEISFIFFLRLLPISGVPPVSITAIDLEPIIKPILAMSPLFTVLESSCFPKCTNNPSTTSSTSKLKQFL